MNKVRYWDNLTAKWLMRHFYFMFFHIVLMIIFLFWFVNLFHVMDVSFSTREGSFTEEALASQSVNTAIIVFLLILNSFWMLYILNGMQRIMRVLKDIHYSIIKNRQHKKRS